MSTEHAPRPGGHYSQGLVVNGDLIFVAGQTGIDPATGVLRPGGIGAQVTQALDNVEAILHAADGSLQGVVKASVFLASLTDFTAMDDVYRQRMQVPPSTRTTVGAQLPPGVLVEIDVIAVPDTPKEQKRG
ncbi:MAG TPA: Rid family detoxifying hydrolase [Patescibacteria group bacterium]|nr:Rid family detoxifying hydrolase [Patescibacteria group bacterium]